MSQYVLEGPITSRQSDLLNRSMHVKLMADFLTDSSTLGYVVSIESAWGSGKTSVLNLLRQQLEDDGLDPSNIVLFNPWLVTDAGALAGEFLKQLSAALSMSQVGEIVNGATQKIDIATKVLKYARYLPIGGAREDLAEFAEALGAAKDALQATKGDPPDISKRKSAVVDALRDLPSPIVVIIDDVDRLPPKDVYEIIRLVRAIGDFPNVRYVLAMDAGYVEKALEKSGVPEHSSYLDKIFHHRFIIPPVFAQDLRKLLMDRLQLIAESDKGLSDTWLPYEGRIKAFLNAGLSSLLGSIRDVNLLGNRVGFMRSLFSEINFADVVVLEALAIKAPSIYRHILNAPSAYTGAVDEHTYFDYCTTGAFQASKAARSRAATSIPIELQDIALRLTDLLFNANQADYKRHELNVDRAKAVGYGLLCAPSRLRIALSRVSPEDGVTLSQMNRFLKDPGSRAEIVSIVLRRQGIRRALWLLIGADSAPVLPEDALRYLGHLLDHPSSQHSRIESDIQKLGKVVFKKLRSAAKASGNPLLTGNFGVTVPYWDALDWLNNADDAFASLNYEVHGAPSNRDLDAYINWKDAQPDELLKNWANHFDNTPQEKLSQLNRDRLRDIYKLRDISYFKLSEASTPPEVMLSDEICNAVSWDIDRKGRRYFFKRDPSKPFDEELATQYDRLKLGRTERAQLQAGIANGLPILEHDCSVVPEEDLTSDPDESHHDYLQAF